MFKLFKVKLVLLVLCSVVRVAALLSPNNTEVTIENRSSYLINDLRVKARMVDKKGVEAKGSIHIKNIQPGEIEKIDLKTARKRVEKGKGLSVKQRRKVPIFDFKDKKQDNKTIDKDDIFDVSIGKAIVVEATSPEGKLFNKKEVGAKFKSKQQKDVDTHFDKIIITDKDGGGISITLSE